MTVVDWLRHKLSSSPGHPDLGGSESVLLGPLGAADREILGRCQPFSMTGPARLQSVIDAVRYSEQREVPGAFVECGVWRGGSVLAMILTLQEMDSPPRQIYLFDTFDGMTEPTDEDVSRFEPPALETWKDANGQPWGELFDPSSFNENAVREMLFETGYPADHLHFVAGSVEETIPRFAPDSIALMRLDTDWYESTRHEMTHLYPRLAPAGVLIIDDYGHWDGCRQAIDEYFAEQAPALLLNRVDYTGRIAVKV